MSSITGAMMGTNTALKYGGPTEILPKPKASSSRGYSVPSSTVAAATTKHTLPINIRVSRDISAKLPVDRT